MLPARTWRFDIWWCQNENTVEGLGCSMLRDEPPDGADKEAIDAFVESFIGRCTWISEHLNANVALKLFQSKLVAISFMATALAPDEKHVFSLVFPHTHALQHSIRSTEPSPFDPPRMVYSKADAPLAGSRWLPEDCATVLADSLAMANERGVVVLCVSTLLPYSEILIQNGNDDGVRAYFACIIKLEK